MNKTTQSLQKEIENLYGELEKTQSRWDENLSELDRVINNRIDLTISRIDELNSYVDSRFDKQADKAGNVISVVSESSMRNGDRLNKLEEIFKLQMDQFAKVTLDHSDRIANLEIERKIKEDRIEQINS